MRQKREVLLNVRIRRMLTFSRPMRAMLWETARALLNRANARFLGLFKFPSSVLRRVVPRLWSVPTVGEHGSFLRVVEFCASSPTTNVKRRLPILVNDGSGEKRTGMWFEESETDETIVTSNLGLTD
jgi:hypothetical protein